MPSKPVMLRKGNLTQGEKRLLVDKHVREPKTTQKELAEWCRIKFKLAKAPAQATIWNILSKYDHETNAFMPSDRKTNHSVAYPDLDDALRLWILAQQSNNVPLSDLLIQEKARVLFDQLRERDQAAAASAPPKFSNSWLAAFKKRHDFIGLTLHGEGAAVDLTLVLDDIADIKEKMDRYADEDVFNFDETGLCYCRAPRQTIGVKDRSFRGLKQDKTRITVGLATNMTGTDKLEPLFIGRAKCPRVFRRKSDWSWDFACIILMQRPG